MTREEEFAEGRKLFDILKRVKWEDINPKSLWVSVEEDLPCNHEELVDNSEYPSTCICVVLDKHFIGTNRMYKTNGKWKWGAKFPNVLYWFPLPKLLKRIGEIYE